MVDQNELIAIIAKAIRGERIDYPAIEPRITRVSVPFAKAVLDRAELKIAPNGESTARTGQKPNDHLK